VRWQFWAALVFGGLSALLALLTLINREWIEEIFGVDPDAGNGTLEWAIVLVSAVVAIACLAFARVEWRRARAGEVSGRG
jgi:apolipoprotein N-acyltransferase